MDELEGQAGQLISFDVVVDGVSYIRNYHDDSDAEIAQNGLNATIARLQKGPR